MGGQTFWLLDLEERKIGSEFCSNTPREAALKAASRSHEQIFLYDVKLQKLHVFSGHRRELQPHELNSYTKTRGITHKPFVQKVAYKKVYTPKPSAEDLFRIVDDMTAR